MQTGRLVTCILKIAGQREHRLPDQVDIGGTARRQKGHGVAGQGLKLRVGGSAAAGGNKQIAVHGVPDEGIPEHQLVGGVIRPAHPHIGQGFIHDHENVGGLCAGAGLGNGVLIQNFLHRGRRIAGGLGRAAVLIIFQKRHDHALALKYTGDGSGPVGHGKARHKDGETEQKGNHHRSGLQQPMCFGVHREGTVSLLMKQKRGPGDDHQPQNHAPHGVGGGEVVAAGHLGGGTGGQQVGRQQWLGTELLHKGVGTVPDAEEERADSNADPEPGQKTEGSVHRENQEEVQPQAGQADQ